MHQQTNSWGEKKVLIFSVCSVLWYKLGNFKLAVFLHRLTRFLDDYHLVLVIWHEPVPQTTVLGMLPAFILLLSRIPPETGKRLPLSCSCFSIYYYYSILVPCK